MWGQSHTSSTPNLDEKALPIHEESSSTPSHPLSATKRVGESRAEREARKARDLERDRVRMAKRKAARKSPSAKDNNGSGGGSFDSDSAVDISQSAVSTPGTGRDRKKNAIPRHPKRNINSRGYMSDERPETSAGEDDLYINSNKLEPSNNPGKELTKTLKDLKSSDWKVRFDAMVCVRRLAIHHPDVLQPKIGLFTKDLRAELDSLRSTS